MTALATRNWEGRSAPRDEVLHRTRAVAEDGRSFPLTIVNISEGGFMARCDAALGSGDRLTVELPVLGRAVAEVRWILGGRIGCRFEQATPPVIHVALLGALR